jgi:hypothetical protein
MDDGDYILGFGAGVFYGLLAWGALRSLGSWHKLLNYALGAMIGLPLFAILVPDHVHPSCRNYCWHACAANLKQMEGAIAAWQSEHKKTETEVPEESELFGETGYIRHTPMCPSGGTYRWGSVREAPTCSFPGHGLNVPTPKDRESSKDIWMRAGGFASGAGTVALFAMGLAAGRRWHNRLEALDRDEGV